VKKRKREKLEATKQARKNALQEPGCDCETCECASVCLEMAVKEVSRLTGEKLRPLRILSSEEFESIRRAKSLTEIRDGVFIEE
jgi:hypothetical protein